MGQASRLVVHTARGAFHSPLPALPGLALAVVAATMLLSPQTQAATLSLGLDVEFSGGQAPAGTAPWVTAVFDDATGDPTSVLLTIEAPGLTGGANGEYLAEMSFNFDPALDPTLLSFVAVDTADVGATVVNTGVNAFMSDGDGDFDIMFDFPPPPGQPGGRFTGGDAIVYEIFYAGGNIDATSFNFFSDEGGGQGTFLSAAHVQNTTGAGEGGSGWIGVVPEPSTASLLALGLVGLAARRRAGCAG